MKNKPIYILLLGVFILIVPTVVYLCFLVPQMNEEYNTLLASGGVISGAGYSGAYAIPNNSKRASLYKLVTNAFTTLTVAMVVQNFINEIFFLIIIFLISFVLFLVLKTIYKERKERIRDERLATTIKESFSSNSK